MNWWCFLLRHSWDYYTQGHSVFCTQRQCRRCGKWQELVATDDANRYWVDCTNDTFKEY